MKRVIAVGLLVIALTGLTGCGSSGRFDTDVYSDVEASDVLQSANAFDNECIRLVGQVEQILERSDGVCLQVDIQHTVMLTGLYLYPDDIHVEYHYSEGESHILPGEVITLYGKMCGVTEFDGSDVRLMYADYIKRSRNADDTAGLVIQAYDVTNLVPSAVYSVRNEYRGVVALDFTVMYYDDNGNEVFEQTQSSTGIKRNDSWIFVFYPPDGISYSQLSYEIGIRAVEYVDLSLETLRCELIYGPDGYNQVEIRNIGAKPFEDIHVTVLYYSQDTLLAVYSLTGIYETEANRLVPGGSMHLEVPSEIASTSYDIVVTANRILTK